MVNPSFTKYENVVMLYMNLLGLNKAFKMI